MKTLALPRRYLTIDEFYDEVPDVDRRLSPEVDFGCWWSKPGREMPRYRVSWVEHSGELYAIAQTNHTGRLDLLAHIEGCKEIEKVLDGWAEACGPNGLAWVWERVGLVPRLHYCRRCATRDDVRVVFDVIPPQDHCGSPRHRPEWADAHNYFCVRCHRQGRTTVAYGEPKEPCVFGHRAWQLTDESRWILGFNHRIEGAVS